VKKVLLDTHTYVAFLRGGNRLHENKKLLESFLARPRVRMLSVGMETADVFGMIKQQLKEDGSPILINDVWISAQAMENGAELITYNRHFERVAGLRLWDEYVER